VRAGAGAGDLMYTKSAAARPDAVVEGKTLCGGGLVATQGVAARSCCPKNSTGNLAAVMSEPGRLRGAHGSGPHRRSKLYASV
jgi:hypothetical protein